MDIDQLQTFLAIVHSGGFTRAAARLHRSQSAISRRLSQLEEDVGAPLLERVQGGIQLTDVGRALLPHAETMLGALDDARAAVAQALRPGAGSVSLAVVGTLVDRRLTDLLGRFAKRAASGSIQITTGSSAEVSRLVRRGAATLGLRYERDDAPELACESLGREEMLVVARPSAQPSAGIERWVGFPARAGHEDFGRLLRARLAAAGLAQHEILTVDSLSAQKRLVESGLGCALLPRSSLGEELRARTLVVLDRPDVATSIPVTLISRRSGFVSPRARALQELLSTRWARRLAR